MNILKTCALLLAASATMSAQAQSIQLSPIGPAQQYETLGMSANHRYVVGLNVGTYHAFVWDTETNTYTENEGDYANCDFRSITDNGCAYGILGQDDMVTTNAAKFDQEGHVSIIDEAMSQCFAVTPDGSLAVGCLLDEMWLPTACYWKDGERVILPCPTSEECGFDNDGANAQFVSADGSVIVGYLQDWKSSRPAIIWRRQADGSYAYDVISKDRWEFNYGDGNPYLEFQALCVSPNGKWIGLVAQREGQNDLPTPEFIVRYNVETGELTENGTPQIEYFDAASSGVYPNSIANDGTCIGVASEGGYARGIIWPADTESPSLIVSHFADNAEITEALENFDALMHYPISISGDGRYVAGFGTPITFFPDGTADFDFQAYLLSLGDTFASIEELHATPSAATVRSYNLQGQLLTPGARGLQIENHRIILK